MTIEKTFEFLFGEAALVKGIYDEESEGLKAFKKHSFQKPYCLVKRWVLVDLEISDEERQVVAESGSQPTLVYAHHVIHDSRGRFSAGDWVRSTLLIELVDGFLFETANTVYILMGDGARKTVPPSVIMGIL